MLLAIDPGTNSPGVALLDTVQLVAADRVALPSEWVELDDNERWPLIAHAILAWVNRNAGLGNIDHVIFERPQWYQRKNGGSKGDPNKLAGVLTIAAMTFGMLTRYSTPGLTLATPAEWIGQLSKECPRCAGERLKSTRKNPWYSKNCPECHGSAWETPRGRRIRSRLTPAELALVPDQNDAIDAVGIGLYKVGRMAPRRIYSNS